MFRIIYFLLFSCPYLCAQSPAEVYFSKINKAEQEVISNNLQNALSIYTHAFDEFDYPFCRNIEQAFYVSCHAHDQPKATLFLSKCIENGLTKTQFEEHMKLWSSLNEETKLTVDYQSKRNEHLQNLDTVQLFQFIEFDIHRDLLINKLKKDSLSRIVYFSEMKKIRNAYLSAIQTYGYPTERKTGAFFSRKVQKKTNHFEGEFYHRLPLEAWNIKNRKKNYLVLSDNDSQLLSMKPGAWFLTHYINPDNHSLLDSTLFRVLERGFDSLKVDPLLIVNAMESTRQMTNEFALTYYSQLWAYTLKFDYLQKFSLDDSTKQIINANRARYYLRSIEAEEHLFEALYELTNGTQMKKDLTSQEIRQQMENEIGLFFNLF